VTVEARDGRVEVHFHVLESRIPHPRENMDLFRGFLEGGAEALTMEMLDEG